MTRVLGIETSCDETSAAVVEDGRRVRSNLIATQFDLHGKYGGVVPEIASRAHIERLDAMIREAMEQGGCKAGDLDAIAVTCAPGLIGSLLVGVIAAKTLAWAWGKPLVGVNHIHAHATSAAMNLERDPWPAVALVVSGGHTSLYHVRGFEEIELLGATIDDAAGEAFDKVGSLLGLGFPGGPIIDGRAGRGRSDAIAFPRSVLGGRRHLLETGATDPRRKHRLETGSTGSLDFSFSGLKTAVLYHVHGAGRTSGGLEKLSEGEVDDICASFSAAVVDVLVDRTLEAVGRTGVRTVVVGGGVAANSMLRRRLAERCSGEGVALHLTAMAYCTDNAAMIAALGTRLFEAGRVSDLGLTARANVGAG